MITINKDSSHKHRWTPIGSHTIHAGKSSNFYFKREIRTVFKCQVTGCNELRVSLSHDIAYAHTGECAEALSKEHNRTLNQTAVSILRRKRLDLK